MILYQKLTEKTLKLKVKNYKKILSSIFITKMNKKMGIIFQSLKNKTYLY